MSRPDASNQPKTICTTMLLFLCMWFFWWNALFVFCQTYLLVLWPNNLILPSLPRAYCFRNSSPKCSWTNFSLALIFFQDSRSFNLVYLLGISNLCSFFLVVDYCILTSIVATATYRSHECFNIQKECINVFIDKCIMWTSPVYCLRTWILYFSVQKIYGWLKIQTIRSKCWVACIKQWRIWLSKLMYERSRKLCFTRKTEWMIAS